MNIEVTELIATRVPPGDNWKLRGGEEIYSSLLQAISVYQKQSGFRGAYRFEPLKGELSVIEVKAKPVPKYYDIYGEE